MGLGRYPGAVSFSSLDRYLQRDETGLVVEGPWSEEESSGYESGTVSLGGELWRIRTARVTPTKPGAFVAVWERGPDGTTRPFAAEDRATGLLVFVTEGSQFGVFRFSRALLAELGITSSARARGKRGFRVYPSWSTGLNGQAARTQRAQAPAFEALEGIVPPGNAATRPR